MRVEQGVKVFDFGESVFGKGIELNEFFIHVECDRNYTVSGSDKIGFFVEHQGIGTLAKAIEIAKALNER